MPQKVNNFSSKFYIFNEKNSKFLVRSPNLRHSVEGGKFFLSGGDSTPLKRCLLSKESGALG